MPNVVVEEVALDDQPPALLVRPETGRPSGQAGVLALHWLGHHRNDRTQLLPDAVRLAQLGAVTLLPQGVFPWLEPPAGDASDATAVATQARRTRHAFGALVAHPLVDAGRVAVMGHDYGGMFALTLRDVSLRGMVVSAPDATWDHWFHKYWHAESKLRRRYADQFRTWDPLAGARHHQDHLLLQWAEKDEYVEPIVHDLYAAAAPRAAQTVHERYDHQLGDRAVQERFDYLCGVLELAPRMDEVRQPA
jgi:dienelactone hydrolase